MMDYFIDSGSNGSSLMPEFLYESTCSSDGMRITKSQKVFGLAVCPTSEIKTAVITSEGKLLVWELRDDMVSVSVLNGIRA